ncbi:RmlC-like jelly roll fold containing protein [Parasponia andersonii]|uniref:RmlC-like jelly roll fold containing protein n=1 Tax=Parasponia andersonii TaxID=3476 RepID=A0A2P5CIZ6_PARAD|nr:RmlC-like jelly roll fold containing protein [Parasponia andersonii]
MLSLSASILTASLLQPLQDFFVADLNVTFSVNGYPCKPISQVTSEDFFFDGLSKEGKTFAIFRASLAVGNVQTFPGLLTLRGSQ